MLLHFDQQKTPHRFPKANNPACIGHIPGCSVYNGLIQNFLKTGFFVKRPLLQRGWLQTWRETRYSR